MSNFTESSLLMEIAVLMACRAACHMMLGQFVQALEDARTSVQFDPNFVKGYVRVAKCCVALGELHAARQAIKAGHPGQRLIASL
jgi:DnaJ family protein C protein 7